MPLYEYECDNCGHRFEVIQKFSDAPIEKCPKCGGPVHKMQSAPAFHLKGTGWYITDYAKKDSSAAGKSDGSKKDAGSDRTEKKDAAPSSSSDKPAEKTSSGTESKPASPPPSTSTSKDS